MNALRTTLLFCSLIAAALTPGAGAIAAPSVTGSISGTIDLRTYRAHGAPRVPPGSRIEIVLTVPERNHAMGVGSAYLTTGASDTIAYRIANVPVGVHMAMKVDAYSAGPTLSSWTVTFHRAGSKLESEAGSSMVTLAASSPNLTGVDFDLKGMPGLPLAFPNRPVTSGDVLGTVHLSGPLGRDPVVPASVISLQAVNADTNETIDLAADYVIPHDRDPQCRCASLEFKLKKLPLDVPIRLSVVVPADSKTANGTPIAFHAKRAGITSPSDDYRFEVTAQKPSAGYVIFYPYAVAAPLTAPTGSVAGTIALDTGANIGPAGLPPDATVRVSVRSDDNNVLTPPGRVTLSNPATAANGTRSITYTVTGLPLGVALKITVEPVQPPGASPLPTGFAWLVRFRPATGNGLDQVASVTLSAASPNARDVDFSAYGMEIPPMSQPPTAPSPAVTASCK